MRSAAERFAVFRVFAGGGPGTVTGDLFAFDQLAPYDPVGRQGDA